MKMDSTFLPSLLNAREESCFVYDETGDVDELFYLYEITDLIDGIIGDVRNWNKLFDFEVISDEHDEFVTSRISVNG